MKTSAWSDLKNYSGICLTWLKTTTKTTPKFKPAPLGTNQKHDYYRLIGFGTVNSGKNLLIYRRNILPPVFVPLTWRWRLCSPFKIFVNFYQTTFSHGKSHSDYREKLNIASRGALLLQPICSVTFDVIPSKINALSAIFIKESG
jgi:hypothetical protein